MSEKNAIRVIEIQPEAAAIEFPHEAGRDPVLTSHEHRASRQSIKRRSSWSRIDAVPESSQDGVRGTFLETLTSFAVELSQLPEARIAAQRGPARINAQQGR